MNTCMHIRRLLSLLHALYNQMPHCLISINDLVHFCRRVSESLQIKVADFGLTRDVYSSDYYRASHNAKLPVKWMPPETLNDAISNEKTDVVSINYAKMDWGGWEDYPLTTFCASLGIVWNLKTRVLWCTCAHTHDVVRVAPLIIYAILHASQN